MNILKSLFTGSQSSPNLTDIISNGAMLVDVREPFEFAGGSAKGAINIPLSRINSELKRFEGKNNIIVFCRSGARSSQAKAILEKSGIMNVINGGTYQQVARITN